MSAQEQAQHVPTNPRTNRDAVDAYPRSYQYHEEIDIRYGSQEFYEISRKIGYGKYSDVFEGYAPETDQRVVIKVLKPVRRKKIFREVKILSNLLGGPGIINLLDVVSVQGSSYPAFVMEHGGLSLSQVAASLTPEDVKIVMFQTLRALDWCHIHGICHRDVKSGNLCYNPDTRSLRLLDFGLAEFYNYGECLHHRVASRHFKSPEILVSYQLYDYSLDVWSLGCMMAGIIFQKNPFFRGSNNTNQLDKIVEVLGTANFLRFLDKYNIRLGQARLKELGGYPEVPLESFRNAANADFCTPDALALLHAILRYDPEERPDVRECMRHRYFDSVRQAVADMAVADVRQRQEVASVLGPAALQRAEFSTVEHEVDAAAGTAAGAAADRPADRPVQLMGIVGLSRSALPSWAIPSDRPVAFPVPVSPLEISGGDARYRGALDDEWTRYWVGIQESLTRLGMAVYAEDDGSPSARKAAG